MHTHGYYCVYPVEIYISILFYFQRGKTTTPPFFPESILRQCSLGRYAKGRNCRQKASRRSLNS